MVCETTAARYREFYTFTYADPTSVVAARPGRGVELFLIGIRPDRRLPLRAAYGGFVVKNGVPIGYIEGLAFFERLEIGFNMYYTFREGESAWIYARMLELHHAALGVTSFGGPARSIRNSRRSMSVQFCQAGFADRRRLCPDWAGGAEARPSHRLRQPRFAAS
jgi:hypothetical protein